MSDLQRPTEISLRDPLSSVTRSERRSLLAVSTIAIVIAWTGLVPAKIEALGIDFSISEKRSLLQIIACIVIYYIVAFVVYASSDLVAWRVAYNYALREHLIQRDGESEEQQFARNKVEQELQHKRGLGFMIWWRLTRPVSAVRAVFEFALPVVIGFVAALALLTARTRP